MRCGLKILRRPPAAPYFQTCSVGRLIRRRLKIYFWIVQRPVKKNARSATSAKRSARQELSASHPVKEKSPPMITIPVSGAIAAWKSARKRLLERREGCCSGCSAGESPQAVFIKGIREHSLTCYLILNTSFPAFPPFEITTSPIWMASITYPSTASFSRQMWPLIIARRFSGSSDQEMA